MNYNFLIISILLSFVLSRETIKSKDIKPKPVNTTEIQNKAPNLKDKDLVKWSNEDKNINNPDYQYEMNKLMEQFKIEKGMIIQEFKPFFSELHRTHKYFYKHNKKRKIHVKRSIEV